MIRILHLLATAGEVRLKLLFKESFAGIPVWHIISNIFDRTVWEIHHFITLSYIISALLASAYSILYSASEIVPKEVDSAKMFGIPQSC